MTRDGEAEAAKKASSKVLGREERPLPRRFYTEVGLGATLGGFSILLDGRPVKTPARNDLLVPGEALATLVAREWADQGATINPAAMPLTRLCNTAIDRVRGREAVIVDEMVAGAGCDLVCYRAEHPVALVQAQSRAWDPIVSWAETLLGATFTRVTSLVRVAQPSHALACVRTNLAAFDPFTLCALHNMTTMTGSLLLPLALAHGRFDATTVWEAAHVDEDHQIAAWGQDDDAAVRRAGRWLEFQAACALLQAPGQANRG